MVNALVHANDKAKPYESSHFFTNFPEAPSISTS